VCGIFGIIYRDTSCAPNKEGLEASARLLHHRGPDAQGIYSSEGVGLAHQRLSLLDLNPRSNQPFWDQSGRYGLVYNGEIYNFKELRSRLENRGVAFHTTSDTEVLLQCLIHDDPLAILPTLEGMFAFGLYDRANDSFLLARDRFGMKPLYLYEDDRFFLFSSEVKAMHPWVALEPDPFSISSYLLGFGGPTKGFTFYKNVKSLAPGSFVTLRRGETAKYSRFFSMKDFWERDEIESLATLRPRQTVDRFEELLYRSVEKHMFADAPVGGFCSGGVDSSVLMAMAAKMHNNLAIFHANIKGRWSEYDAALKLSRHLKLDLKSVEVTDQDFILLLPDVMDHYEHPFTYHPNCAPLLMVSRLVKENNVKGMLTGEGSDECFLGYPWLGRQKIVNVYNKSVANIRNLVNKIPHVGKILWPWDGNRKEVVKNLLNRCEIAEEEQLNREAFSGLSSAKIPGGSLLTLDYLNYHLRTLLHRNDCMGMAASIEARFPFLDHDVVRFAVNMPYRYKLRFSPRVFEKAHPWIRDKWVVRKAAERYIPRDLSQRIKIGFWTTAFERMQVSPAYFSNSLVRELFALTQSQMDEVIRQADQDLRTRLLHLDLWEHVCLKHLPHQTIRNKLVNHVRISADEN
jgi:asparagine synthase (glutamine-hydrolysing)